ncbi:MAG: DUF4832 domain-containing protein [Christensenellaceae bacterium]
MKKSVILTLLIALTFSLVVFGGESVKPNSVAAEDTLILTETTDILKNPDRGIYMLRECFVKDSATPDIKKGDFQSALNNAKFPENTSLILLHFDLSYYSSNNKGTTKNITSNGLQYIDATIKNCVDEGFNVILRFDYDLPGESYSHDDVVFFQPEPPLSQIITHIEQLSPIVNKYKDYVYVLQSGMFGPWGEQHSTSLSKNADAYYQMLDTWLMNTDSSIYVGVRYPYHFLEWYNKKYSKNYTSDTINQIKTKSGTYENRICMYDDGYLAASDDWGTYKNRTKEIEFFNSQTYSPFGGEACSGTSGGLTQYNKISYVEVEAFKTHTSYLNYQWDYEKVIKYWEKQIYTGKDSLYKSAGATELRFIINRLGYRLVVRNVSMEKTVKQGEKLNLNISVENVGFGNVSREQNAYLVLVDQTGKAVDYQLSAINVKDFLSQTTKSVNVEVSLNNNIAAGNYKLYLKIIPKNADFNDGSRSIRLANQNIFNESLNANYLGSFTVTKGVQADSSASYQSSQSAPSASKSESALTTSQSSSSAKSSNSTPLESGKSSESAADGSQNSESSETTAPIVIKKGCKSSLSAGNLTAFIVTLSAFAVITAFVLKKNNKSNSDKK